jgi:poly(A) polymerase Pap1
VQALLRGLSVPVEVFRLAHRALRLYFAERGAVGARFGLLGGFQLAVMLSFVCGAAPGRSANTDEEAVTNTAAARLVRRFLSVYAHWDWERDMVLAPAAAAAATTAHSRRYHRAGRERMVVLSVERPQVNTMANASIHSVEIIKRTLMAGDRACQDGLNWRQLCGAMHGALPPLARFVKEHGAFVKIEVVYWGSSCKKGRALIGWLESRFVSVSLGKCDSSSLLLHTDGGLDYSS